MHEEIYKAIGKNIKNRRVSLGLTQQELAEKIGKSLNHIGKVEIAFCKPSLPTLIDISKALDIDLYKLFKFKF